MVEFENAVGRALATTEDPDYDVPDNKLYTGEQKIMIRPYPLPGTAKVRTFMLSLMLSMLLLLLLSLVVVVVVVIFVWPPLLCLLVLLMVLQCG